MKIWMAAIGLASLSLAGSALAQDSGGGTLSRQDRLRENRLNDIETSRQTDNAARLDELRRRRDTDRQERQLRQQTETRRSVPIKPRSSAGSVVETQ